MEVGPSAAPMMPMEAASFRSKPKAEAIMMVRKIPPWAAAPHRNSLGLDSRGPKSIMAPMPMNSRIGMASLASMPTSNSHWMIPWVSPTPSLNWFITPDRGRLTRMAPKPMGIRRAGSKPFSMASQIRTAPTTYMTICWGVMASRLTHKKFKLNVFSSLSSLCFDLPHAGPTRRSLGGAILTSVCPHCLPDNQKAHEKRPAFLEWNTGLVISGKTRKKQLLSGLLALPHSWNCADYSP